MGWILGALKVVGSAALKGAGAAAKVAGTAAKGVGTAAKGLGSYIGKAAGNLLNSGKQVTTVMGKPVTLGQTIQGGGASKFGNIIKQAVGNMLTGQRDSGSQEPGKDGNPPQGGVADIINQGNARSAIPLPGFPSYQRTSAGELLSKYLQQRRGF